MNDIILDFENIVSFISSLLNIGFVVHHVVILNIIGCTKCCVIHNVGKAQIVCRSSMLVT